MKTLILLFALIGAAFALVPGKQYKYQYEGRIGLGLPEIRNRVAGTGLKCTVNVQAQTEEDVVIKLEDIQVGEYKGDVKCSIREPMPIQYQPLQGQGQILTEPYMIHIHRDQNDVMLVPKTDIEWMTNIRKSIAGLFLIEPLRNNYGNPGPVQEYDGRQPYQRTREHSIFGECDSDYVFALPDGFVPNDQDQKYGMTRSINFDSCQESVALQQTSIGNTTIARENQFSDVSSRFSKMSANLTYDGERYTLQEGMTEGHLIVNPFGLDHDKVVAIVNQTYQLQSTQDISDKWQVESPAKSIKTWYMESASPFSASDSSPLWVNFYDEDQDAHRPLVEEAIATGIPITQDDINKYKGLLDQRLDDVAAKLQTVDPASKEHDINPMDADSSLIASEMESSFRLVRMLDDKATQDLFDKYSGDSSDKGQLKLRLLIDAIGAAGTGGPLKVFVDNAQKGKITPERAASVFMTLPNNLFSVPALVDLERYVKSLTLDKDPFPTATVWINFASTVNKICLNDRRYRYATLHEVFGKKDCDSKARIDSILPFFRDQLSKATEDYKRIILIHAIGNLGTVQAHSILVSIVKDRSQSDTVRVTAVYGLARNKLPDGVRDHVFRTLRPIVERRDESPYVRQASIIAILSWKPPPSFLQSLAASTWNEPSDNMASFIYSILKDYAESSDLGVDKQSRVAKFALRTAKPYAPSRRYSDSRMLSKYSQQDQLTTDFDISWLKRDRAGKSYTEEIFAFLINSLGGLRYSVAQGSLSFNQEGLSKLFQQMVQSLSLESRNVRSSDNRRAQEQLMELQKRMSKKGKQQDSPDYSNAFLSFFDNMELLLPLTKDSVQKTFGENGSAAFKRLLADGQFHGTKFINPAIISLIVPSEMGLPMFIRVSSPTVNGGEASTSLTCDNQKCGDLSQVLKAKEIRFKAKTNYKFTAKTYTMIRALQPWSERVAAAGVETLKSVNLPVDLALSISKSQPMKNVSLSVTPNFQDEFEVVHIHTIPFVITKSMWPGEDPKDLQNEFLVVSHNGDGSGTVERERPINMSYTGISGKLRYEGDIANPFNLGNAIELSRRPEELPSLLVSPTSRLAELVVTANFGQSPTKEIHASVAFRTGKPTANEKQKQERQQRQQKFKLQEMPDFEVDANLMLNGSESRYYEVSVQLSRTTDGKQQKMQLSAAHQRNPLPHFDPKPKSHCLDVKSTGPSVQSIADLRQALDSNAEVDYQGSLDEGTASCHEQHVASISGKVQMSDDRRKRLQEELNEQDIADPNNPMVSLLTAPVYDQASLDITYDDKSVPRDIRNASYHIYDLIRGFAFPHVYFNYMDQNNQQGKISLRGNRYLGESRWEVQVKLPTESSKYDRFRMPHVIENIVPVGGLPAPGGSRLDTPTLLVESQMSPDCSITNSQVRTFDGYKYDYAPEHCDTNAVINREDQDAARFMSAQDDHTGNFRGVVKSAEAGITMEFDSKIMKANGKEVRLSRRPTIFETADHRYFAEAIKTSTYIEVQIKGNFTVKVSDNEILITPSHNLRTKAEGLCGNYDGSTQHELIGEQGCVYDNQKLFAESWTEDSGAGCDRDQYQKEQQDVDQFRQHCPKQENEQKLTSILSNTSPVPEDCIEYVYKIKKNDGALCVTSDVVAICYPLCKLDKPRIYEEVYNCWPEPFAPKELARNLKRGFIRHKIDRRAYVQSAFSTEHAYMCSRK